MTRLTSPEGVTVSVDDEYGADLQGLGWKPVEAEPAKPKPARRVKANAEEDK